jgi:hypothetical protein
MAVRGNLLVPMKSLAELLADAVEKLPGPYHDRVVVFGSAPMVLAGLKDKVNDLDLFTSVEAFDSLVMQGFVADEDRGIPRIRLAPDVSLYKDWPGVRFWDVFSYASISSSSMGLKVASLHHMLAFKLERNDPAKDAADIERLRRLLDSGVAPFWSSGSVREKIDVWYKYQSIAMHFNDLLLRLRTQALAGLTVAASVAALFSEKIPEHVRVAALRGIFVVLSLIWIAIAVADQTYYQRMLLGTVEACRTFERDTGEALNLSVAIQKKFLVGSVVRLGALSFYILILAALVLAAFAFPAIAMPTPAAIGG